MHRAPPILRFGVFELNLATEELRKFGTLIKLAPQPFELLALLASQAGQIVTREQIQFQLWGEDTFVDFEQGMNHCIRQVRNVLGDNAETPRYIETIPRRGYRFVAPVDVIRPVAENSLLKFPEDGSPRSDSGTVTPSAATVPQTATKMLPQPEVAPVDSVPLKGKPWLAIGAIVAGLLLAGVVAYGILHAGSSPRSSSVIPRLGHPQTVAVMGFKNGNARSDPDDTISIELSTMLDTELAAGDQLRIVPRAQVENLKREMHLENAESLTPDTLVRIRKVLGADYVVLGTYRQETGRVRLDLRVQDTRHGDYITLVREDGPNTVPGLGDLVSNVAAAIRPKLGVPAMAQDALSGIRATHPAETAATYYYQGLAKLRDFDALGAREELEKAVAVEPDFAPSHLALAEALTSLGYSKLAREEAKKAYDDSANLPSQERLLIEARYNELTNKWDDAIAQYAKLWDAGHNNVDYGLSLASAQSKAGKGHDALETVKALRSLPQPESDDLRIDLEEANAFYKLGDYEQEQKAADAAARKAEPLGGFALALARKAQGKALFYRGHLDEAMNKYRESLAISEELGDKGEIASGSNNVAAALQGQGKLTEALELYGKALAANRELGNRRWEAGTLSNMGSAYQLLGKLQEAKDMYQQSLSAYSDLGDRVSRAIVLNNIAEVQFLAGDLAASRQTYDQAISLDRTVQNSSNEAEALFGKGQVLAAQGDLTAAERTHRQSLDLRKQLKEEEAAEESQLGLAAIALARGDRAAAATSARDAAQAFQSMNAPDRQVEALILLARASVAQGKQAEAAEAISGARTAASALQNRILLLDLELAAAQVASRSDSANARTTAMQDMTNVLEQSTNGGYLQLELAASLALAELEIRNGSIKPAQTRLAALRKQAAALGFGLVVRQATAAEKMKADAIDGPISFGPSFVCA